MSETDEDVENIAEDGAVDTAEAEAAGDTAGDAEETDDEDKEEPEEFDVIIEGGEGNEGAQGDEEDEGNIADESTEGDETTDIEEGETTDGGETSEGEEGTEVEESTEVESSEYEDTEGGDKEGSEEEGEGEETEEETIEPLEDEDEESEKSIYDPDDFVSGPSISHDSTLKKNLLTFHFSYGYDCRKYFNLTVLDPNTIVFSSGNFLNFFDAETKKLTFKRSALGGGIGHIRKNPNDEYPHFAVAECGESPIIIIYDWPDMNIIAVLRGGASKIYSNLDFSPDGELLVSQSGDPDYLITVWNWKKHKILLRTKSYVNEVFRVKFSPYVPGQLTTCGLSHIKFWKMASTFTGLKLKGELGRFGKTEYSDIIGVLPMPDAKVVSGCSWGNILVWDAGLITFEVFRTLRRKCHDAPIVQFFYFDGELWTVSMDGHVKIWWYEKIDQADPPDDDRVVLVDPSYDFYTPGLMLMSIEKRRPGDPTDSFWYGQDGNGGIALIDLNTDAQKPATQLYKCHAGKVVDIAACPSGPYLASLGEDGRLYIYSYLEKIRIFDHNFPAKGVALIWVSMNIVLSGDILLLAFDDGQVRVVYIKIEFTDEVELKVVQVVKPHHVKITKISINKTGSLFVSAGEDKTIFIFRVQAKETSKFLVPIGFIDTPGVVTAITWHFSKHNKVLLGCKQGQIMLAKLPDVEQDYTTISYKLDIETHQIQFMSYKAQIRRNIKINEIEERKAVKREKKRKEMLQIMKENPGLEIDEEAFLADSDSEEELEPLYIPEIPNRIIWIQYSPENTIWPSMAGYDAGYIYEYEMDQKLPEPINYEMVFDADDIEISSYVYTYNGDYLVFGMQDGSIRVNRVNKWDFRDLSDYFKLPMHDNQNGFIPTMCFSFDESFFFSCGYDGNIFAYRFNPEDYKFPVPGQKTMRFSTPSALHDVDGYAKLSLEETKITAEHDRVHNLANQHKVMVRQTLKTLKDRYKKLLMRNSKLIASQVIPRAELELDDRVLDYVKKGFQEKLDIVERKLAYDVEKSEVLLKKLLAYFTNPCDKLPMLVKGINSPGCNLMTVRQRLMPPKYYDMLAIIEQKLIEEEGKGRAPERALAHTKEVFAKQELVEGQLEYFLLSLSPTDIQMRLGPKLQILLKKYRIRKAKWEKRNREWEDFMARKPEPNKNHPDDEKFLEEAKTSFGDYKLKESDDYKIPKGERVTTVRQYKKLLETRGKQYTLRHNFIQKVYDIRDNKYEVIEHLKHKQALINGINEELPLELRRDGPPIPEVNSEEFPQDKLMVKLEIPVSEEMEEELEQRRRTERRPLVKEPTVLEIEDEVLFLRDEIPSCDDEGYFQSSIDLNVISNVHELDITDLRKYPLDRQTPYEACLLSSRLRRKHFLQKLLISEMQDEIDAFNNTIIEARKERLPILIRGNFIDIFILCLNEELNILKSYDASEDVLAQEVNENIKQVHALQDTLDELLLRKNVYVRRIEELQSEEGKIQEQFKVAAESNKFYNFLRKVFKKKFKPPKTKSADDSSSSSSSSSSDESEDDTASIDSRDFAFIKQDLNTCPKGCEPALFNLTVELRTKRQIVEQTDKEEVRALEVVKKDIELHNRKMTQLDKQLVASQSKLEAFQLEKQRRLNEVRCTVVLNLDQIYGFNPEASDISEFLVFSKSRLSHLYKRVGQLQQETIDQQRTHRTYLKHLMRLKKDINYMRKKIMNIKQEIVEMMKNKFGKTIDINELEMEMIQRGVQKNYINELEEVVLKKLVYDLRIKTADIRAIFVAQLNRWGKCIAKTQEELTKVIKENTNRLELLALINREKQELAKFVTTQDSRREKVERIESTHKNFIKEVQELEAILERQCKQIRDLKEEIKMLKTKGLPPRPLREEMEVEEKERQELEEAEEAIQEWIAYEDYIEEELVEEEEHGKAFVTEITLPAYLALESEDIVKELVEDLFASLDKALTRRETENLVREILSGLLKCTSVTDILNEILDKLPFTPSDVQQSQIELAAEKLYGIQEPEVTFDSVTACVKEILEEVLYTAVPREPHEIVTSVIEMLVENLPIDILTRDEIVDEIILKMVESGNINIDRIKLKESLDRMSSAHKNDIVAIINMILEKVYGEGIDLLYMI